MPSVSTYPSERVSDSDSDHSLVLFQTGEAIVAVIEDRDDEFIEWITRFACDYAAVVRDDHRLFVECIPQQRDPRRALHPAGLNTT